MAGRVSKPQRGRRSKPKAVLRMMAIMTDGHQDNAGVPREFLETGRTGRRNAMPDILQPQSAEVTTADLPQRLQQLATSDPISPQPSTSKPDLQSQGDDGQKASCS